VGIDSNITPRRKTCGIRCPAGLSLLYVATGDERTSKPMISGLAGSGERRRLCASESPGVCGSLDVPRRHQLLPVDERRTSLTGGGANTSTVITILAPLLDRAARSSRSDGGTSGMHSAVYPNSAAPSGPTNVFNDYGFDTQYDYLGGSNKASVRFSYIYENQSWNAGFPQGASSTLNGNIQSLNLNGTYTFTTVGCSTPLLRQQRQ